MGTVTDRHFIAHMMWDEVARHIANGAAAILPIGAAAKQHGFHLPLDTDRIQAEFLASRLAERIDALIWPKLHYGFYPLGWTAPAASGAIVALSTPN
jgi:creatinine amidohydrolase